MQIVLRRDPETTMLPSVGMAALCGRIDEVTSVALLENGNIAISRSLETALCIVDDEVRGSTHFMGCHVAVGAP